MRMANFSEKTTVLMQRKGLNRSKLAELVGVSPTAVKNWLQGKFMPRPDVILKLSKLFEVAPEVLTDENMSIRSMSLEKTTQMSTEQSKQIDNDTLLDLIGKMSYAVTALKDKDAIRNSELDKRLKQLEKIVSELQASNKALAAELGELKSANFGRQSEKQKTTSRARTRVVENQISDLPKLI